MTIPTQQSLLQRFKSVKHRTSVGLQHMTLPYRLWRARLRGCKISDRVYIGPRCLLAGSIRIGQNTTVVADAVILGDVTIGNNVIIASHVKVLTRNHEYNLADALPYGTGYSTKPVVIEDNVWIGDNVILVPGVHLGEGCVVGIGSVVTKDVPPGAVVGGNPATVIKHRDMDRYQRLKREGRYLNDIRGIIRMSGSQRRKAFRLINTVLKQKGSVHERDLGLDRTLAGYALYAFAQEHQGFSFLLDEQGYLLTRSS